MIYHGGMNREIAWLQDIHLCHAALSKEITTDVLIVWGGILWLSLAHHVVEHLDTVLIEQDFIGSGSTGRSAGMLTYEVEWASIEELINTLWIRKTELYIDAHRKAQDKIATLIKKHHIPCESHVDDTFLIDIHKKNIEKIEQDRSERMRIHWHTQSCKKNTQSGIPFLKKIKTGKTLCIHPLKFIQWFANVLSKKWCHIYEHTPYIRMRGNTAYTSQGIIHFKYIIFARGNYDKKLWNKHLETSIGITAPIPLWEQKKLWIYHESFIGDNLYHSFVYGRMTKKGELLLGYGDTLTTKKMSKKWYINSHHRSVLEKFLNKYFPRLRFRFLWTEVYSLFHGKIPHIIRKKNVYYAGWAGLQLTSFVLSSVIWADILKKYTPLKFLIREEWRRARR